MARLLPSSGNSLDISAIPLALYVHLPWCERKCPYCDFNSHEQFNPADESGYIDALLRDLQQQISTVPMRRLHSIFLGGGTPSLFSSASIGRLLAGVDQLWGIPGGVEVTMEANPGSAEASRFMGYRSAGVNRLSLGIQSFDDRQLKALGRVHDQTQAREAIAMARANFERVNLDIMHGLAGQTINGALADLNEAVDRSQGHVSWYQLTIEPNTTFWSRPPTLPTEDTLADIQNAGEARLGASKLKQYEVSAWAAEGQQSVHNLNYWSFGDYLGIGAGAHGKVTQSDGGISRMRRTRLPRDYLAAIAANLPPHTEVVDSKQLTVEFMLNALRLRSGVSDRLYRERTGLDPTEFRPTRSALIAEGLMSGVPGQIGTTPLGFRFLDTVVARFIDT